MINVRGYAPSLITSPIGFGFKTTNEKRSETFVFISLSNQQGITSGSAYRVYPSGYTYSSHQYSSHPTRTPCSTLQEDPIKHYVQVCGVSWSVVVVRLEKASLGLSADQRKAPRFKMVLPPDFVYELAPSTAPTDLRSGHDRLAMDMLDCIQCCVGGVGPLHASRGQNIGIQRTSRYVPEITINNVLARSGTNFIIRNEPAFIIGCRIVMLFQSGGSCDDIRRRAERMCQEYLEWTQLV